jgi:hypothetical protein
MSTFNVSQPLFFDPSCLSGGHWYVCPNTTASNFVGCCEGDHSPCDNQDGYVGCLRGNVRPASFNASYAGKIQSQDCDDGGKFYACPDTVLPFLGCCTIDACSFGSCPLDNLTGVALANGTRGYDFLGIPSSSSNSNSSTTSSSPSSATTSTGASNTNASASSTSTAPASVPPPGGKSTLKSGGIAGVAIGAVALVALVSVFAFLWRKHQHKKEREREKLNQMDDELDVSNYHPQRGGEHSKSLISFTKCRWRIAILTTEYHRPRSERIRNNFLFQLCISSTTTPKCKDIPTTRRQT